MGDNHSRPVVAMRRESSPPKPTVYWDNGVPVVIEKKEHCQLCGGEVGIGDWPWCGGDPAKHRVA